ncbi:MAG: cupin domain-containing protein [Bacteriovoracaceae bacterium]|nr:cupin domain-containing protein [Bacteriovoracaceae bacterium]
MLETIIEKTNTIDKEPHSPEVNLIKRIELDCLSEVVLEGETTYLGEVRNFKKNQILKHNIPQDISISWSALQSGEKLNEHYHPCESFLIITEGEGESTGDSEVKIKAGDIVFIPKWNLHGFLGTGTNGFKALSIQFQETAIFESEEKTETTYFQRESIPLKDRELQVFSRDELPTLSQALMDGNIHQLGTLKNFSSIKLLEEFFPKNFSCAWVKLENGESLAPHTHFEDSMIIVTEGRGSFQGNNEFDIVTGDILFVPEGSIHGFSSPIDNYFWALSIQFNKTSLYQNEPRVKFLTPFEELLRRNDVFSQDLVNKSKTFKTLITSLEDKNVLLDSLQVISDHFQRLMFLRVGLCDSSKFQNVFLEHFHEELGHNDELRKERTHRSKIWDPVLEASCAWFVNKNYLLDNSERIIMVQMVLEKCAHLFYSHFSETLLENKKSEHIETHKEADEGHDLMGVDLLKHEPKFKYQEFYKLQKESWSIMKLFIDRVGELIEKQNLS